MPEKVCKYGGAARRRFHAIYDKLGGVVKMTPPARAKGKLRDGRSWTIETKPRCAERESKSMEHSA